jgi:hypothetical protein
MKKFFIILISVLFAAPLSSLLSHVILNLMMSDNFSYNEHWSFLSSLIIVAVYEVPIYIVVGIPVTLLIDFVLKLKKLPSIKKLYLFQFLLYSLSAIFFWIYFITENRNVENVEILILIVIAVHTYFHILFYLRKRFNKE